MTEEARAALRLDDHFNPEALFVLLRQLAGDRSKPLFFDVGEARFKGQAFDVWSEEGGDGTLLGSPTPQLVGLLDEHLKGAADV